MNKWEIAAKEADITDASKKVAIRYVGDDSDDVTEFIQRILVNSYVDRITSEKAGGR